jgi:hypothetical protein
MSWLFRGPRIVVDAFTPALGTTDHALASSDPGPALVRRTRSNAITADRQG